MPDLEVENLVFKKCKICHNTSEYSFDGVPMPKYERITNLGEEAYQFILIPAQKENIHFYSLQGLNDEEKKCIIEYINNVSFVEPSLSEE